MTHLTLGAASAVQRGDPLIVLGVDSRPIHDQQVGNLRLPAVRRRVERTSLLTVLK